ncbi:MAG TPA: TetR/AcrR family transcriptional regulator [Solirubrobacterales bacterium]|jgi:AcrR family transcriptional regulator
MSRSKFDPHRGQGGGDLEGFPRPPARAKLPAGRHSLPRQFVEQNQRSRILLGALDVFGGEGLAAARVQDVITGASVSRATFYKYFSDKEECMAALHEEVVSWLADEAREASGPSPDWPSAVRAVSERVVGLLAADPRVARVCAVEAPVAGDPIRRRHEAALADLAGALRKGRSERPWGKELPRSLEALLLAGALGMVSRTVVFGHRPGPKALARQLPEMLLIPYLGAEDARIAIEGPA